MYFDSRLDAGLQLAKRLTHYRSQKAVVVALSDGGVQVGRQIASALHADLTLLLTEPIDVPGENIDIGTLNQSGRFTYNGMLSAGEIDDYLSEFHGQFEDKKREGMGRINRLLGSGGIVSEQIVREHHVVLVADGLPAAGVLDSAADFFKPLNINKLIICTPVASVEAVDRAHIVGDELHILSVTDNYLDTGHYYESNEVPSHHETLQALSKIVLGWAEKAE